MGLGENVGGFFGENVDGGEGLEGTGAGGFGADTS